MARKYQSIRSKLRHLPPFDPERHTYTPAQLEIYGTKILIEARDEIKDEGLTVVDREVLDYLEEHDPASAHEMGMKLVRSPAATARSCKRLAELGRIRVAEIIREPGEKPDPVLYELSIAETGSGLDDDWLDPDQLEYRQASEVYNKYGVPEPETVSGLFKRTYRPERRIGTPPDGND